MFHKKKQNQNQNPWVLLAKKSRELDRQLSIFATKVLVKQKPTEAS
jgi:hypothetical protein